MHNEIYQAVRDRDLDRASAATWAHLLEFASDSNKEFDPGLLGLFPRGLPTE